MNESTLTCKDEQRRPAIHQQERLNGLDYVEISDDQRTLSVYFLGQVPGGITKNNVRIEGGQRIRDIKVTGVKPESPEDRTLDGFLQVYVDRYGDFSTYTLHLVEADEQGQVKVDNWGQPIPLQGFDRHYVQLKFNFKVGCPNDLDCKSEPVYPPEERIEPEINYLAKDYASFRQLILDRFALIMPEWRERHIPDLGITLVELLAYVGDYLSYYQDAVATEAYLDTARQRISVRRHVRLVDYWMHEGCNARTWVWIEMRSSKKWLLDLENTYFITSYQGSPTNGNVLTQEDLRQISPNSYEVFEPLIGTFDLSPRFHLEDLRDLASLAAQWRDASDLLTIYLRDQLLQDTRARRLLNAYIGFGTPSKPLQKALLKELNSLIQKTNFYFGNEQSFAGRQLSEQTQALIRQRPQGKALVRLHRWLLEEAYPREFHQSNLYVYEAHNEIHFYTWGDRQCCLPKGSTKATLRDYWISDSNSQAQQLPYEYKESDSSKEARKQEPLPPDRELHLKPGDILIFEEVKGAKTGNIADADPTHRHAVRLIAVKPQEDPLYPYKPKDSQSNQNLQNLPTPVVEIEWAVEDALPFSLCISGLGPAPQCCLIEDISVARGNVVLVDRGRTIDLADDLGKVEKQDSIELCDGQGRPTEIVTVPKPFRPKLQQAPLTFSQPLFHDDLDKLPASKLLDQDPRQALPQITKLIGFPSEYPVENNYFPPVLDEWKWSPKSDLLSSYSQDRDFVVEMDNEGYAHLRFGDGELGKQPKVGTHFYATYRVGNGTSGNIGADTIAHIVFRRQTVSGITLKPHNPFPAKGGTPPEPLSEVKLFAPTTFRKKLQRAITAQDYADIVMRDFPQVQRAAATLRWTGSWYEVLVAIDPRNIEVASDQLLTEIEQHLYLYRRMGHDVVVKSAINVPLAIAMKICVLPDYLRGHVKAALMDAFSSRRLLNGQLGFFHPDNLTFGTGIYLSRLVAAAQAVQGVMSVQVTRLKRLEYVIDPSRVPASTESSSPEILNGALPLGSLEIARLDNDPSFPENGVLKFEIGGGR